MCDAGCRVNSSKNTDLTQHWMSCNENRRLKSKNKISLDF